MKHLMKTAVLALVTTASVAAAAPNHHDFEKFDKEARNTQIACGTAGAVPFIGIGGCGGAILGLFERTSWKRINEITPEKWKDEGPIVDLLAINVAAGTMFWNGIGNILNVAGATSAIDALRKDIRKEFGLKYSNGNLIEWDPTKIDLEWDNRTTSEKKATRRMQGWIKSGVVKRKVHE